VFESFSLGASILFFSGLCLGQTNVPLPSIEISEPTNGEVFVAPTNVKVSASISYGAAITNVEFFANGNALGKGILAISSGFGGTFSLTWTNPLAGIYTLTAVGLGGQSVTSSPVNIIVEPAPPPTNYALAILTPTNGESFAAPTSIQIVAGVNYLGGPTNVEFFANSNLLGTGELRVSSGFGGLVYFTWLNPVPGAYTLTASGMNRAGALIISSPIDITVESSVPVTNPPLIRILSPTNGQTFIAPTNIELTAGILFSTNSFVPTNVEFFAGANDLGSGTFAPTLPISALAFSLTWSNVPVGDYVLTAVVTGNAGLFATSAPVSIIVQNRQTNLPPVVRIVGPANGASFRAPINIPVSIFAYEQDAPLTALAVELFANSNSLGFASLLPLPASGCPNCPPPPDFGLVWSNAPPGDYVLTAVASDTNGSSTVSAPIHISILPAVLPPTNRPAIVSVIATDPIAIAGTNSWVWPEETNTPQSWSAWPIRNPVWQTNSGPKTAVFTISRFGRTNGDLVVAYDLGGTASNGVDYIALPGVVTIPAGQRQSIIPIVPIDNNSPTSNKTVLLTLVLSTNAPPDYLLGLPRQASALIIEGKQPWRTMVSGMLPGAGFYYNGPGPNGAWFYIESSSDLVHWKAICTNQVIDGSIDFIDPNASANPVQFYRTVPLANPPTE
jgi:hypothetical protein